MRAGFVWLLFVVACGGKSAGPGSVALAIAPTQSMGWIGLAPHQTRAGDWLPIGTQPLMVPMPVDGIAPGIPLSAIGVSGRPLTMVSGSATKVPYGCERNQLDAVVFTGKSLPAGPVWVLPRGAPARWQPRALAIEASAEVSEARRVDHIGPLTLELTRRDASHVTLRIMRDGQPLHSLEIERAALAGADLGPIDLRQHGVAIPVPIGAWSVVEDGPILVFFLVPAYEGQQLRAILAESTSARELPAMDRYLYQCAV